MDSNFLRQIKAIGLATAAIVVLVLLGCSSSGDVRDCRAGEPRPIFRPTDSTVVGHDFEVSRQKSLESVGFADGFLLAIAQRGCDTLVQEFTLAGADVPLDYRDFVPFASTTFYRIAGLSDRLAGFGSYARLLSSVPPEASPGRPVDLAPGLTLKITSLPTPERVSWRMVYTQDLGAAQAGR